MKQVKLSKKAIEWYLNNPEIWDLSNGVSNQAHDEIPFIMAAAMYDGDVVGIQTDTKGRDPGFYLCVFGPFSSYLKPVNGVAGFGEHL